MHLLLLAAILSQYIGFSVEQSEGILAFFQQDIQNNLYDEKTDQVIVEATIDKTDPLHPKIGRITQTISLSAPKTTAADFSKWLTLTSQLNWFWGHNRALYPVIHPADPQKMWEMALKTGQIMEKPYSVENHGQPDVIVILGSGEEVVKQYLAYLRKNLEKALVPKLKTIILLGANRPLGHGVRGTEQESIDALKKLGREANESEMLIFQTNNMLHELKNKHGHFKDWTIELLHTEGAPNRNDERTVKTADTAITLKKYLDKHPEIRTMALLSRQPFIDRQTRDVQEALGDSYKAIGFGPGLQKELFQSFYSIFLGELARLMYKPFAQAVYLQPDFQRPLTEQERNAWRSLMHSPT